MVKPEKALFDSSEYAHGADGRLLIPERLGSYIGEFLDPNRVRYARIFLTDLKNTLYIPGEDDELEQEEGTGDVFRSPDYANGTSYRGDFNYWDKVVTPQNEIYGYLVGFPRLRENDQRNIDCLHCWENDSDIFNRTMAVPLLGVRGLFLYSKFRTRLQLEIDHLSDSSVPEYEVPLLRNKNTGETYYRDATLTDIQELIDGMEHRLSVIYGEAGLVDGDPVEVLIPGGDRMKQVLDK